MNCNKLWVQVIWLSLLYLMCVSCEKSAVENQQDEVAFKVQAQGAHLSLIDAITLERPEEGPALGRVRALAVLKDHIIIVDATRARVEVFDREGNYKWPIGSRGDGEGQYKIPFEPTVVPNTDQMLIYDGGQVLRFSIQGEFLGQVKLPERRFINRMVVSEDHNLIHTYAYADKNRNGMLCVTSLDTGKDLAKFKVTDAQYRHLFGTLKNFQGLAYDEVKKMIYFVLPWEDKIRRIDLTAQEFLTPIVITHPKFIGIKVDEVDDSKDIRKFSQLRFSKLYGMYLLSSGDILLRYMFDPHMFDPLLNTGLILVSNPSTLPSVEEVKNELGYNIFTCHGNSIYVYSPSEDDKDTNGRIRVYRLIDPHEVPTG